MDELQDVTLRYINCGDPTESAARQQRVTEGESRGLMAETAARLARISTQSRVEFDQVNCPGAISTSAPPASENRESSQIVGNSPAAGSTPNKRKRGRPPIRKSGATNQNPASAGTRKRKVCQIQISPISRRTTTRTSPNRRTTRLPGPVRPSPLPVTVFPASTRAPAKASKDLATSKRDADFHNPQDPLP